MKININDMSNKLTVLMPTFNRAHLLKKAINSVLEQSYKNIIVKVFDNASTDSTESLVGGISSKDDRVEYYCHASNIGMLANFKFAFSKINTPFFSILTDDDLIEKNCYSTAINLLNKHPEIMFVVMGTLIVDENMRLVSRESPISDGQLHFYSPDNGFEAMHNAEVPLTCIAMVFRSEAASVYLEMNDEFDAGSDIRFLLNLAAKYKFAYLSKVGAIVVNHSESFSALKNNFDVLHQAIQVSRYAEIYKKSSNDCIRNFAIHQINKLLSRSYKRAMILGGIRRLLLYICNPTKLNNDIVLLDIFNSKNSGFLMTSKSINFIYRSRSIKYIIHLMLIKFYNIKSSNKKKNLAFLENKIYKKLFDDLFRINQT
jgi:glycosyltransferase involved in cell wall biosynthesis